MIDKNGEKINNNLIILSSNVQFCEGSIFADIILDINRFYLKNTVSVCRFNRLSPNTTSNVRQISIICEKIRSFNSF